MAELVCDTSALVALHQIGRLDILRSLGAAVTAPEAVREELETGRSLGHDVPGVANFPWLTVRSPTIAPTSVPNAMP